LIHAETRGFVGYVMSKNVAIDFDVVIHQYYLTPRGIMSNLKLVNCIFVCLAFFSVPAMADPKLSPDLDYPSWGQMGHDISFNSWITASCQELPVQQRTHRIACRFQQTTVLRPSSEDVSNKVTEASSIGKRLVQDAIKDPKVCQSISVEVVDTTIKDIMLELKTSCVKKDAIGASAALTRYVLEIEAKTCTINSGWEFEREFTQVDQNTWVTVNPQPYGICNSTSVITLWRKSGDSVLWNYKRIRSVPPNSIKECADIAADPVDEYSWEWAYIPRLVDCKYISF